MLEFSSRSVNQDVKAAGAPGGEYPGEWTAVIADMSRTADARDTRDALNEHFSSEQIVEITLIVAMANFTNRFNNGLELKPEE